jgi:hypothetical protein
LQYQTAILGTMTCSTAPDPGDLTLEEEWVYPIGERDDSLGTAGRQLLDASIVRVSACHFLRIHNGY